jgi:hypothetical protein
MYLPPHELRMWNSRLYCSYCIMDIQDDEQRIKREKKPEGEGAREEGRRVPGTCERCGRQTDVLYVRSGQRLCMQCSQSDGEAGTGRASLFGQLIVRVKKALGLSPRLVAKNPPEAGWPSPKQQGQTAAQNGKMPSGPQGQQGTQVFSIKDRQMEERKPEITGQKLMGEEPEEKKKPAPKAKKFFFAMHPEEKGGEGKSSKK